MFLITLAVLPSTFIQRMQPRMGSMWPSLQEALLYGQRERGLRAHTDKISLSALSEQLSYPLDPVPWCPSATYLPSDAKPGCRLEHTLGLYYIQEPSALAAVETLNPQPGEWVLDLCASPGGKSTHISSKLANEGLLVLNEVTSTRRTALFDNIERWGTTRTLVMGEHPDRLAECWPDTFDAILVDAPCSGEGMFRKSRHFGEIENNLNHSKRCSALQIKLLTSALTLLRPGGRLLYSTCTFNPEENESVIAHILATHSHVSVLPIPSTYFSSGEASWTTPPCPEVAQCARLWPHQLRGEGHFLALLTKEKASHSGKLKKLRHWPKPPRNLKESWTQWSKSMGISDGDLDSTLVCLKDSLYALPEKLPYQEKLRFLRPGLPLGKQKGRTFVPSHALARVQNLQSTPSLPTLALTPEETWQIGKQGWIPTSHPAGLWLLTSLGFPYAWGKISQHGILRLMHPQPALNTPQDRETM